MPTTLWFVSLPQATTIIISTKRKTIPTQAVPGGKDVVLLESCDPLESCRPVSVLICSRFILQLYRRVSSVLARNKLSPQKSTRDLRPVGTHCDLALLVRALLPQLDHMCLHPILQMV